MTIGACSPPCSSSEAPSASVDSASAGRKLVDSLFSASEYLPGRLAAPEANSASRQKPTTRNFALRPAGDVRKRGTAGRAPPGGAGGFFAGAGGGAGGGEGLP